MKKLINVAVSIFVLYSSFCNAQKHGQARIDSLLHELIKSREDTNKVNLLNALSIEFYDSKSSAIKEYSEESLKLSEKINWTKGQGDALNNLGRYYNQISEFKVSLTYFTRALKIFETLGAKKGIAASLGNIGLVYDYKGDYRIALEYYFKALEIKEQLGDKKAIAISYGNIGIIYYNQADYPKALEYYLKALKIYEETGDKSGIARNLGNIGNVFLDQSNFDKALEYYTKALGMHEEIGNKNGMATILANLANIYDYKLNRAKALEYYTKSFDLFKELGDKAGMASDLGNIGLVYSNLSDYTKALEYYFNALKINEELGIKEVVAFNLANIGEMYIKLSQDTIYSKIQEINEFVGLTKEINLQKGIEYSLSAEKICKEINELNLLIHISLNLYEGYKRQGDYFRALEYHEQFSTIQDSVFNINKAKSIANLEAVKDKEIADKQIEIQRLLLIKARNESYLAYVGLVFLAFIIFIIYRQRKASEKLLLNILPKKIASRLKRKEKLIADRFDEASVLFIDQVSFTEKSQNLNPEDLVSNLDDLYSKFDILADKYGLEKIKTIGDCYMAASGIPETRADHAEAAAKFAIEAMKLSSNDVAFRCGIDCGPVVAGVIGKKKFIYDLWGDTVNTASRMEEYGEPGKIQITDRFKKAIENSSSISKESGSVTFIERGEIEIKGKGLMITWFFGEKDFNLQNKSQ